MAFQQAKQQPQKQQGWGSSGGFGAGTAFGQPQPQQSPVAKAIPQPRMLPGANPFAAAAAGPPAPPPPPPPGFGGPAVGFGQATAQKTVFGSTPPVVFGQNGQGAIRAPLPQRALVATEFNFGKPQPPQQPGFMPQPIRAPQPPTAGAGGLRWGQAVPNAPIPNWGQGPAAQPVAQPQAPVVPVSSPVPPPAWGNWGSNQAAAKLPTQPPQSPVPVKLTLPTEWTLPPPMHTQPAPQTQPPQMAQPVPWGDLLKLSNTSNNNVPVRVDFPPQPPPPMPSVKWPSWTVPVPVPQQQQQQQQAQPLVQPMQLPMQPVQPQPQPPQQQQQAQPLVQPMQLPMQPVQPQPQPVPMQPARPATKLEPAPKLPAQRKSPARQATPPPPTRAVPMDMTPPRSNLRELFFRDDLRAMPPPAPKAASVAAATQTSEDELAAAAAAVTLHQTGVPQAAATVPAPMPTLRDPSLYWCTPTLAELAAAEAARPGALASVEGFVLGARGQGHIRFLAPVDLRGAPQLDDVVTFEKRAVAVYAGASGPPPPGQGLNVATEVTLLAVFPSSRRSASSSGSDNEGAEEAEEAAVKKAGRFLRKLQAAAGTRFVAYDAATGTWRFKLEHF